MNQHSNTPSVLFVDDDEEALRSLVRAVQAGSIEAKLHAATGIQSALQLLNSEQPLSAVVDLCLDSEAGVESGFSLLRAIRENLPSCRVIVLTGHGSTAHGVRALREGAASFLVKPADVGHLSALINDGINQARLMQAYQQTLSEKGNQPLSQMIIGVSPAAVRIREEIMFFAHTNQPLLITGETGTGKGVCALAVHRHSLQRQKRFVRFQPGHATGDLTSSDLFGHVKGAFTGAVQDRDGLVTQAEGGTLFLDEIDELPLETQVLLLGVLQDRHFRKIGSDHEYLADFRVICATNQIPEEAISQGKLRDDFYHRVAHQQVHLAPLRERRDDILHLAFAFLSRLQESGLEVYEIDSEARALLQEYSWPGNIRELEGLVTGAAHRARYDRRTIIQPADVRFKNSPPERLSDSRGFHEQVEDYKHQLVAAALRQSSNNQVHAAAALGIDRSTLRRYTGR